VTTSEHEVTIRAFERPVTPPFDAVTTFEGRGAIVSLRGRVDDIAAFELAAVLNAAIDRQPVSMVLELADLVFMGAAGLVVIANAERRPAWNGCRRGAAISGPSNSTGWKWCRSGSVRACRHGI